MQRLRIILCQNKVTYSIFIFLLKQICMKQMLKPFVVIVLLTTIFIACKKGVEDTPPVNKLTASFSVKGDGAQGPCTDTFMVTSTGAERYSWKFGDGSVTMGTDKMVTHLYNGSTLQDTTYTVTLTAYAGKDSAMASKNITVKQRKPIPPGQDPVPDFIFNDTVTIGKKFESPCTIKFTNTSQYGETYLWDFGNGVTSKATDTMITYTLTGTTAQTFHVTLTVNNRNNNPKSKIQDITINPKAVVVEPLPENVDFTWSPNPPIASVDSTVFTADSKITNAAKYIWQFNDGSGIIDSTSGRIIKHFFKNTTPNTTIILTVKNNAGVPVQKSHTTAVNEPTKVSIIGLQLTQTPLHNRTSGTVFTWDQKAVGTNGDNNDTDPDFSVIIPNDLKNDFTTKIINTEIAPTWDFITSMDKISYNKATGFSKDWIFTLLENGITGTGSATRTACNNITFRPDKYITGANAFPKEIYLDGRGPNLGTVAAPMYENVQFKLILKWE